MRRFLDTLWDTGIRLRCPVCEQGQLFAKRFTMNATCPHCSVRFERYEGEVTGGMTVSIVLTTLIFLVGYVSTEILYDWAIWVHFVLWIPFVVLFPILFYPYSRALWVACLHFTGDVHWDREPYQDTQLSIMDAFLYDPNEKPGPPPTRPSSPEDSSSSFPPESN